jgi:hypothetical protein
MTVETLSKHTEQNIGNCKELLSFLKKKNVLDLEYSKNLSNKKNLQRQNMSSNVSDFR